MADNARLAAGTVRQHLGEDPAVLALQVSRRLPARLVQPLARRAARRGGTAFTAPLGAFASGQQDLARRQLQAAAEAGASGRRALRLADVAIAAGLADEADRLLANVDPGTSGRRGTAARRRWYDGDMAGAVAALAGGGRRDERQRQRLASELRVFTGWAPQLPPVPGYRPEPDTVLHLLTNSLPHTGSGYAQRSHSLLKAQCELGATVHAVTRTGYPVQVGRLLARQVDVLDGVVYHRDLPASLPPGFDQRLQQQAEGLLQLALELRPGVLHTTTHFVNGLVVGAVARALGIPWVYEVRGQLADTWAAARGPGARQSQRYHLFRARERDVMAKADAVATLGEAMKADIVGQGIPADKVLLLPNAVGDSFLAEPAAPPQARRQLGLPEEGTFIGTVSSLVDYEGLDDLLRAFARLAGGYPELRCLIVGDGVAAPGLRALSAELGIAGRVLLPGRVPRDQAHLYHQALDVFVVPRKDLDVTRAVTPLKPVEAMASARPVAASDLPALRELVSTGRTGVLFRAGDPGDQAAALGKLVADARLREELGTQARAGILRGRTWAANATALAGLYTGLKADIAGVR
ncbi:glycosyltransferase [Arthrobacter sp. E918]|uniref:D-inositol 3-phosphate glycosyltransferase n=1 Tax=Arthrobacter mobilis TaxID=2724944 RepID=A0A7X6HE73_9MICC|nr:glycosyltransferase [Arthrobacter mobilis]